MLGSPKIPSKFISADRVKSRRRLKGRRCQATLPIRTQLGHKPVLTGLPRTGQELTAQPVRRFPGPLEAKDSQDELPSMAGDHSTAP